MALIKCPECGHTVSDKAKSCPNCGYALEKTVLESSISKKKKYIIPIVFGVIVVAIGIGFATSRKKVTYTIKEMADNESPVFQNVPEELSYHVGDEVDFKKVLADAGVSITDNIDNDMSYQVDSSNVQFDVPGDYKITLTAKDQAENETKEEIPVHIEDYETHKAYKAATSLTKESLTQTSTGSYKYDGIHISDSELEDLEAGTMYRSISKQLEGFYLFGNMLYNNWNVDLVQTVFGIEKPQSYSEMKPYVDNIFPFVTPNSTLPQVLSWIQKCSTVTGEFNYETAYFSFTISDLTKTASELGITEKMLGYVLAVIDEYSPEITFSANTYSCEIQVVGNAAKQDKNTLTYDDLMNSLDGVSSPSDTENVKQVLDSNGEECFRWAFYDESVDTSKEGVINTNRNVRIGMSYNTVIYNYGYGAEGSVSFSFDDPIIDVLNDALESQGDDSINFYKEQAVRYMAYKTADGLYELIFIFDSDDNVSWIIFDNSPTYS